MRLLPFILSCMLIFGGCSAGAGMQATPAAPIGPAAGSIENASSQNAGAEMPVQDLSGGDAPAPVSQSIESSSPTGSGGRFLLV